MLDSLSLGLVARQVRVLEVEPCDCGEGLTGNTGMCFIFKPGQRRIGGDSSPKEAKRP